MNSTFMSTILCVSLLAGSVPLHGEMVQDHRFEIEPHLWVHHVSGDFAAGGLAPTQVDWRVGDLSGGFSGRGAYVSESGWGLQLSGYLTSIDRSGSTALSEFPGGELSSSMGRMTVAPMWLVPTPSEANTRLWAGAQMSRMSIDVQLTRADFSTVSGEATRTWWDPVVGMDVRHPLGPKWFLFGSAGIGGFGVNSRLTSSLLGSVGYQFDPTFALKTGYRWEMNDYHKDGLLVDAIHQGLIFGLQFNF